MRRKLISTHRFRGDSKEPPGQDYWLSYSDLMAGLLMVFALMLLVAVYHYTERLEERIDLAEGAMQGLVARKGVIDGVRAHMADSTQVSIVMDTVTAMIRLDDQVLFEEASFELLPQGRQALTAFANEILPIILGEALFVEHLDEIIVEGHTNDNGPFFYNLNLSQQRAFVVMQYLLEASPLEFRQTLEQHMTANGRSFSWPVCLDGKVRFYKDAGCTGVDKELSRRIELRFRLDDDEALREVSRVLRAQTE